MDVLLSVPVVFEAGVACKSTVGMTGPYEHELLFRTYVHDYHDSSGSLGSTSVFRPAVFIPRARFIIDSPAAVFCNVRCAPFCDGADGEERVDTQGRGDRGAVNYIQVGVDGSAKTAGKQQSFVVASPQRSIVGQAEPPNG